jgi:putative alpha-1,2-mannosidase
MSLKVNPLMGTASKPELSNGNTYPAVGLPWGMNYWTPQTGKMGNGWAYTYDADASAASSRPTSLRPG